MENLGEYAEEESPNTETRQMSREPMLEEVTAHSSELMQTIKDLKTEMESVKKDNERILTHSRRVEPNFDGKISD